MAGSYNRPTIAKNTGLMSRDDLAYGRGRSLGSGAAGDLFSQMSKVEADTKGHAKEKSPKCYVGI